MVNIQKYTDNFLNATLLRFIPRKMSPNQMTYVRFISLPFIFYLLINEFYGWGLILFSLSALTDALDGAMARKRHRITNRGKIIDPLADKALILLVAFIFIPKYFGWPLLGVIAVLEVLNATMAYRSKIRIGRNPRSNWAGKVKMIIQSIAFIFIFIGVFTNSSECILIAKILLYISLIFIFNQSFLYSKTLEEELKSGP